MYKIEELWAVGGFAFRYLNGIQDNRHCLSIISSNNEYEAIGKAKVIVYKFYPIEHGYHGHHFMVRNCTKIDDTENINNKPIIKNPDSL